MIGSQDVLQKLSQHELAQSSPRCFRTQSDADIECRLGVISSRHLRFRPGQAEAEKLVIISGDGEMG